MSRVFSKISPLLWDSKSFKSLQSDDAKYCYLYLITNQHQTSAGGYKLPPAYGACDLNWDVERFSLALVQLVQSGLIHHDEETSEIFITKWFKHNLPNNPNYKKGTVNLIQRLESETIRQKAFTELDNAYAKNVENIVNADANVSNELVQAPHQVSRSQFDRNLQNKRLSAIS